MSEKFKDLEQEIVLKLFDKVKSLEEAKDYMEMLIHIIEEIDSRVYAISLDYHLSICSIDSSNMINSLERAIDHIEDIIEEEEE